jgi:hypothetical protein
MGLVITPPLTSENINPEGSVEYWYLDRGGTPPDKSVNAMLSVVSELSIRETLDMTGAAPTLFVVPDAKTEVGDVHDVPETALNRTL